MPMGRGDGGVCVRLQPGCPGCGVCVCMAWYGYGCPDLWLVGIGCVCYTRVTHTQQEEKMFVDDGLLDEDAMITGFGDDLESEGLYEERW